MAPKRVRSAADWAASSEAAVGPLPPSLPLPRLPHTAHHPIVFDSVQSVMRNSSCTREKRIESITQERERREAKLRKIAMKLSLDDIEEVKQLKLQ